MTAPAFVQISAFQSNTSYSPSLTATLTGCTPGNMLVAFACMDNGVPIVGNFSGFGAGWIQVALGAQANWFLTQATQTAIFIYPNNQNASVSVTWNQPAQSYGTQFVWLAEFTVPNQTYAVDLNGSSAYATTGSVLYAPYPPIPTGVCTHVPELALACLCMDSSGGGSTNVGLALDPSWTVLATQQSLTTSNVPAALCAYKVLNTIGPATAYPSSNTSYFTEVGLSGCVAGINWALPTVAPVVYTATLANPT